MIVAMIVDMIVIVIAIVIGIVIATIVLTGGIVDMVGTVMNAMSNEQVNFIQKKNQASIDYKICWMTVNRACNLNCKWCYAKETKYKKSDDMDIMMAFDIIDLCKELNIRNITLIGGEPTIYPYIADVIEYANSKNISCGLVTNGLKLAEYSFVSKLIKLGQKSFSISVKGENPQKFRAITGKDEFSTVIRGIKNCLANEAKVSVSMVLDEDNIDSYLEGVQYLSEIGVQHFRFSFCYEFDTTGECKKFLASNNPKRIVTKFINSYDKLNRITNGRFSLFESLPLCIWDKKFIELLEKRGQIKTVCQLLKRTGLIFDSKGNLIPCNAMPSIKIGSLYKNFKNASELKKYAETQNVLRIYNMLCSVPDEKCLNCSDYINCGGGCVCNWTNYTYKDLIKMEI